MGTEHSKAPVSAIARGYDNMFPILLVGLIAGLDGIGFAVAVASLLFTGPLQDGLAMGAGASLLCTVILGTLIGLRSGLPNNMAHVQDMGVAVLAVTLSATVATIAGGSSVKVATAFVIIALASAATGLLLVLTGWLKAGRIVKFFPLEVLAGFMAGTGWLLVTGAMSMTTGAEPTLGGWLSLTDGAQFKLLLPTLVFGVVIYVAMARLGHPLALLGLLLAGVAAFYGWLFATGTSVAEAAAAGFLPTISSSASLGLPFPAMIFEADWAAVAANFPTIFTVALLCLFAALMNTSALELATARDVNMDRELKITGYGNLLVAGAGGPPGYSGLAISVLAGKLGANRRGAGLVMAAVVLVGFFYSQAIVAHVPLFVSAGLIFYFGIDLLHDWLIRTRRKYSLREWGVVVLIVMMVAGYGFLEAIVTGFLVATILFAYSYANVPVIRRATTLAALPSTIERALPEAEFIAREGRLVKIIQLQGFLFFGTADKLISTLQDAFTPGSHGIQMAVLDFTHVTSINSASASAIMRLKSLAQQVGLLLLFCGVRTHVASTLRRSGLSFEAREGAALFGTLDQALEHAEMLLLETRNGTIQESSALMARHASVAGSHVFETLLSMMDKKVFKPGEFIIRAGEMADHLHFLERGRATVSAPNNKGQAHHLRTMGAGALLGDVAFALGVRRTADVIALEECTVLSITAEQIRSLEAEQPELALAIHRVVGRALAEKVIAANRMTEHVRG